MAPRFGYSCSQAYMSIQGSKAPTPAPAAQTDEEKKAERLAKLEAWKQKQAAERERKQRELATAGGARNILTAMDKKSGILPATSSPQSPAAQAQNTTPEATQPAGYAGKFDPKVIAKKASATASGSTPLGNDVAVPDSARPASIVEANKPAVASSKTSGKFSPK
jgi:ATP-dependent RNA helicase DDX46/PRP5